MSQLPQQAIVEFQAIWSSQFGEELDYDQAVVLAHDVFAVVRLGLRSPRPVSPRADSQTLPAALISPNDPQSNQSQD